MMGITIWIIGGLFTLAITDEKKPRPFWEAITIFALWPTALGLFLRDELEKRNTP
jgi:hypothetical protein